MIPVKEERKGWPGWGPTRSIWSREDEGAPRIQVHEYSIALQNYQDIQGIWQPIQLDHETLDGDGFDRRLDRLARVVRLSHGGRKRLYLVAGVDSAWVEIGKPDELPALGVPTKSGGVWTWRDWASPTDWALRLIIENSRLKWALRLPRKLSGVSTLTLPFTSQGITRQGRDLLHQGQVVAQLRTPTVTDALGVERPLGMSIGGGAITLTLDDSGLTYPLVIDPPLDYQVGASADDCFVYWNGSAWVFAALTNTSAAAGYGSATDLKYGAGLRWLAVAIAQAATITVAYLTMTANASLANTVVRSYITGDDEDNAATWSTLADYKARRGTVVGGANDNYITSAQVAWDNIPAWTINVEYQSPSIVSIPQEIVNRAGWASGNAMAMWWDDHNNRSTQSSTTCRNGYSYDGSTTKAPKFHVEVQVPAGSAKGSAASRLVAAGAI